MHNEYFNQQILGSADGTSGLTIANSTGHVTMPNTGKGIFQVQSNSNQSLGSNSTTTMQLDQKVLTKIITLTHHL